MADKPMLARKGIRPRGRRRPRPDEALRVRVDRRLPGAREGAGDDAGRGDRGAEGVAAARSRRRVLRHRPQVELRPEAGRDPEAALPRRQRRRVGAGQLQGQRDPLARPPPLHRGLPDHRARGRVEGGLRLRPRRVHGPVRDPRRGAPGARGAARHPRRRLDPRPPGRRRVHLRRGDGAPRVARGQARPAADEAAVPGRPGSLRVADRRQQRRDDDDRAARDRAGREGVRGARASRTRRGRASSRSRATSSTAGTTRSRTGCRCARSSRSSEAACRRGGS